MQHIIDRRIKVLNIIRDGRDVIQSSNNYVKPKRWIESMRQSREYKDLITLQIKYEDFVKNPDKVQKLIATKFELDIKFKFSK